MFALKEIVAVREHAACFAKGFDPDLVAAADAAEIVREAAAIKNMASTIEALACARVAETELWKPGGDNSVEEWLARETGTSKTAARERLNTGRNLHDQPEVVEAARAGQLSAEQAAAISDAAAADPASERKLVKAASRESISELRQRCQRTKAAADPHRDATHARIRSQRRLRQWTDGEGAWNLTARSVVDDGAEVHAALDDLATEMFEAARLEGRRESHEAYLLDALVELARRHNQARRGPGPEPTTHDAPSEPEASETPANKPRTRRPGYLGLIRLDFEALVRDRVEGDELCEIAGLGPIPIRIARQLLGGAVVKLIITKGVDVANITHLGRGPTVAQRTAMLWANPLCKVEGCPRPWTEADHRDDWAFTHQTRLDNLDGFCDHHHDLKTHHDWALVAGTGTRPMVPPDHPDHPRNQKPAPGGTPDPATDESTLFATG